MNKATLWRNRAGKEGLVELKEVEERKRLPLIPKLFFEAHPNVKFGEATKLLKKKFHITGVTKSQFTYYRNKYKKVIPGMKSNLNSKIPRKFFMDNPNAEYSDEVAEKLKDYGVDWKVDRIEFMNRKSELSHSMHLTGGARKKKRRKTPPRMTREAGGTGKRKSSGIVTVTGKRKDHSVMDTFYKADDFEERERRMGWVPNPDDLINAILRRESNLEREAAREIVNHVLNFFGYNLRIIDNALEPEDRDAFNMLEDMDILTTERDEIILYDGREWRIHYWLLNLPKILDGHKKAEEAVDETVYSELPEEVWDRTT